LPHFGFVSPESLGHGLQSSRRSTEEAFEESEEERRHAGEKGPANHGHCLISVHRPGKLERGMPGESHDFASLRRGLVAQLAERGITDALVLETLGEIPRELFVPEEFAGDAYRDVALPIDQDQTISQPYIVALMTQSLRLRGLERVLEVGTGSGYQTALLSRMAREVVTIERIPELAEPARRRLAALRCRNVTYVVGDGSLGSPTDAPYDGILVTAAAPRIPPPLYDQLVLGGRLIVPVGDEEHQTLQLVVRTEAGPRVEDLCGCRFVKLVGAAAWPSAPPPST